MAQVTTNNENNYDVQLENGEKSVTLRTANTYVDKNIVFNVDGSINEVQIGGDTPTDPNILLWVTPDDETITTSTNKLYVTPEEFGAVGDGTTDDSKAFEDMFAALRDTDGVAVLTNKYLIDFSKTTNGFITISNCSMVGLGHTDIILTGASGQAAFWVHGTGVISGIHFIGRNTSDADMLLVGWATQYIIRNNNFEVDNNNYQGYIICLHTQNNGCIVENNIFYINTTKSGGFSVHEDTANQISANNIIRNNVFTHYCPNSALRVWNGNGTVYTTKVYGNVFVSANPSGGTTSPCTILTEVGGTQTAWYENEYDIYASGTNMQLIGLRSSLGTVEIGGNGGCPIERCNFKIDCADGSVYICDGKRMFHSCSIYVNYAAKVGFNASDYSDAWTSWTNCSILGANLQIDHISNSFTGCYIYAYGDVLPAFITKGSEFRHCSIEVEGYTRFANLNGGTLFITGSDLWDSCGSSWTNVNGTSGVCSITNSHCNKINSNITYTGRITHNTIEGSSPKFGGATAAGNIINGAFVASGGGA